jgi:DnaJ-domain-containing protein 1
MPETIRAARIVETYYARSYTTYRNLGGQAPSARDSVQISKEALDKFRKLKENLNSEQSEEQPASTESDLKESLNILDLGATTDAAQVRKAYLTAVNRYHPDKFANMPPEFRKLAEEKTKEINTAYDRLKNCMASL